MSLPRTPADRGITGVARSARWKAVLVLVGVLAGLGVAELLARALYVAPWYERLVAAQVPGAAAPRPRTNAFNLRDRNYESPKPANVRRVLVLGDSFTFGLGVADDAKVFPRLLDGMLNERQRPGIDRVEVMNGGIPASLTRDWVALLGRVGDHFQPDVILVVFFLRDGTRLSAMDDFFGPIRDEVIARNGRSSLYQSSYLYRLLRDASDRGDVATRYAKAMNDAYLGDEAHTAEWRETQQNLLAIVRSGTSHSATVGLVVFPVLADFVGPYPFEPICERVRSFAAEHSIRTHELLPAFKGQFAPDLWISAYDQHPNEKAHAIAARSILPFVEDLLASAEKERK